MYKALVDTVREWFRKRRREKFLAWKKDTIKTILTDIFIVDIPYIYHSCPSFLQSGSLDIDSPVYLDLFFQDYPFAIDILGPECSVPYNIAQPFISRSKWEMLQKQLSTKKQLLSSYRCPYLIVNYNDPVDVASLREKVKTFIGHYPK